jgi:transmembrane sensor
MNDNEDYILKNHDAELTQASEWMAKLVNGSLTDKDEENLQHWLSGSSSRAESLLKVSDTWDELSELSQLSELLPVDKINIHKNSDTATSKWFPKLPMLSGVSIMLMLTLVFSFITFNFETQDTQHIFMTDIGKRKTVTLPDGTLALLNTDSQIQVLFDKSSLIREVILSKGEVYFEVETDLELPFIVIAGDKRVRAVGTAFNLFFQADNLEVIVTEGVVEVSIEHIINSGSSNNKETIISKATLSKGHSTVIKNSLGAINTLDNKRIDRKLLWQKGKLYFKGERLDDVILTISRYTNLDFVFLDEMSKDVRIGGYYDTDNIESMLRVLENNFNVKISKQNVNTIHISYK